jgi:hypothetical protein
VREERWAGGEGLVGEVRTRNFSAWLAGAGPPAGLCGPSFCKSTVPAPAEGSEGGGVGRHEGGCGEHERGQESRCEGREGG